MVIGPTGADIRSRVERLGLVEELGMLQEKEEEKKRQGGEGL
jgi:hypothetical protein